MSRGKIFIALFGVAILVSPNAFGYIFDVPPPAAVRNCAGCDRRVPEEGALSGKYRLGKPAEFDDGLGINDGRCFPLYAGSKLLTWLNKYHQVHARTYVLRCVIDPTITVASPTNMGGFVEDVYEEMLWSGHNGEATFTKLYLPLWSEYSNPTFCNSHVAYWGTESDGGGEVKVHAILFDLNLKEVVKKEFLGALRIESDSRSFFAAPEWEGDGQRVLFDNMAGKETIADGGTKLRRVILSVK